MNKVEYHTCYCTELGKNCELAITYYIEKEESKTKEIKYATKFMCECKLNKHESEMDCECLKYYARETKFTN